MKFDQNNLVCHENVNVKCDENSNGNNHFNSMEINYC